jgi:hypothetical protein
VSAAWCAVLPLEALAQPYEETDQDPTIRTAMDAGPAKVRRRYTAAVELLELSYYVADADLPVVLTWYRGELQYGAVAFVLPHPRTREAVLARLIGPPRRLRADGRWLVSLSVEVLP